MGVLAAFVPKSRNKGLFSGAGVAVRTFGLEFS